MNESASTPDTPVPPPPAREPRRSGRGVAWLLLVLILLGCLAVGAWYAWRSGWIDLPATVAGQLHAPAEDASGDGDPDPDPTERRLEAMEQSAALLEGEQRRLERRLSDASNGLRLVREEALAFSRRAELLEESVNQLSERRARGDAGLRLDEVELLLSLGRQRLELAGDIDAARRAYVAARDVLRNAEDPGYTNLRQSLEQELAALRAVGEDPRDRAIGELAALESALPQLPAPTLIAETAEASAATPGTAERLLSRLVRVHRTGAADAERVTPAERAAALQALRVELTLARAAAERRDEAEFDEAIARIEARLGRLFADTAAVRERRERLRALAGQPLAFDVPLLGSTLDQLRGLRLAEPAWAPASPASGAADDADMDASPVATDEDAGAEQP